ncbi:hypothetical protein [Rhizobium sp. RCC_161_2]|uniref:hypothetical protein n=1 Tax=Rhizobium sp. RCC_161_2 TaxID=3239219 RepID=UPI0035258BC0
MTTHAPYWFPKPSAEQYRGLIVPWNAAVNRNLFIDAVSLTGIDTALWRGVVGDVALHRIFAL